MCTVSTSSRGSYHHGDLRAALLTQALDMLETSPTLSLRALAKKTGVSPTAVYRHFADKQALESALAAHGYSQLHHHLTQTASLTTSIDEAWRLAYTYATWARDNQPLFSLMFTTQCDPSAPERVEAVATLTSFLTSQVTRWYPDRCDPAFLNGLWALVHGMATLAMQGKIFSTAHNPQATTDADLAEHIRTTWQDILGS